MPKAKEKQKKSNGRTQEGDSPGKPKSSEEAEKGQPSAESNGLDDGKQTKRKKGKSRNDRSSVAKKLNFEEEKHFGGLPSITSFFVVVVRCTVR